MAETCITCLSTQNLIDIGEEEWKVFDILLHPICKKYSGIRTNELAKLCTSCQHSFQIVERFRASSLKNFLFLMNVWNRCTSSTNATDDPLSTEPLWYTNECVVLPATSPTCFETILTNKIKKENEDILSDKEEEETIFSTIVKTETDNNLDLENHVEEKKTEEQKQTTPVFRSGRLGADVAVGNKGNDVIFPLRVYTKNPGVTQSTDMVSSTTLPKPQPQPSKEKSGPVTCEVCGRTYATSKGLTRHEDIKHGQLPPVTCILCYKTFRNKYSLKVHIRNMHEERIYCDVCDKYYARTSYSGHFKKSAKHNTPDDLRFVCEHCSKEFPTKNALQDHLLVEHLNLKPFKCPHCPLEFKYRRQRSRHVRVDHENRPYEKRFKCNMCGKAWHTSRMLREHMSVHTGERPYRCGECGATFSYNSALYLHNKYKHEQKKCPPKQKKINNPVTEQS